MGEKPSFLEDLDRGKPDSFKEEVFTKRKRNFTPIYVILTAVLVIVIMFFVLSSRGVVVPDMANWKEGEVYSWGQKNGITIVKELVYDTETETGILVSQAIEAGEKIKKSIPLNIVISQGPDPNELVTMIDFKMFLDVEIETWIDENKLTGITIKYEKSDVIEKGKVINYVIIDGSQDEFKRKNRVNIFVSNGPETISETLTMPDFFKRTKAEVAQWANTNSIVVTYTEKFDDYVEYGQVLTQSINKETKITRDIALEIELSLGIPIVVPDFRGLKRSEAAELATRYGVPVFYTQVESTRDPDLVLNQDILPGTNIHKKQEVTLEISKESEFIVVPDFIGLTSTEASTLAGLHGVRLFFVTIDSTANSDKVLSQDIPKNGLVNSSSYVTVNISSGDIIVPNFVGLTKEECTTMATLNKLQLVFNEVDTVEVEKDRVISQNIEPNTTIAKDTQIKIDVARNTGIIAENLESKTKDAALLWGTLKGITITFIDQYSDVHVTGKLFNQNIVNELIPSNAGVIINYSLGKVGVTDFTGSTKLAMLNWVTEVNGKGAKIKLNFIDVENSTKAAGTIINQSYKSDIISVSTTIDVWVSTSQVALDIPDMTSVDEEAFIAWCTEHTVPYLIAERYSDTYAEGKLFGQNYKDEPLPEGEKLMMYKSIGRLNVLNSVGETQDVFIGWANSANLKGADLTIVYAKEISYTIPKGSVVNQSILLGYLSTGSTITVTISAGREVAMPSLTGKSINSAIQTLESQNMEYEILYEYSSEEKDGVFYPKNNVISQSFESGRLISQDKVVTLVVSLGVEE